MRKAPNGRKNIEVRNLSMTPFAFFLPSVGPMEMLILAFVCLLIFGNRLPSAMRSLGKSVTEFKKGISGIEDEIDQAGSSDKKPTPPPNP
jgi:sec-independent protein translocase protein TatA